MLLRNAPQTHTFFPFFPCFPLSTLRSSDHSESQMTDFFVGLELVDV